MSTQRWYESDGNTMNFYHCGCSMPHVVNHLSNHINMLQEQNNLVTLNANAETFAFAKDVAMDNVTKTEEKENSGKASENGKKDVATAGEKKKKEEVEAKENAWKRMPIKGTQKGNHVKREETAQKRKETNVFSRLQELLGDEEETIEVIREAQDKDACEKQMKNVEKRKTSHHVDDVKIGDMKNVINNFTSKEKVKNKIENKEKEIKSREKQKKEIEIEDSDEESCDSEEECEQHYEKNNMSDSDDCPSDYDEWLTWSKKRTRLKQKWKERSHSE